MRRFLHGSILFSWLTFMASVMVGGFGAAERGLLQELQFVLMILPFAPLSFETARGLLTGAVVASLSVTLWALMIAVTSARDEHRERVMSLGIGFAWVLGVTALAMIAAATTGTSAAAQMLFAIQMATLLSMLAAGGVEFVWESLSPASAPETLEDDPAERVSMRLVRSGAGVAAMADGRSGEAG